MSSSEPPSTLSAPQRGARTLVLNTIARRVAVDIRREACRIAHIRAAVADVCTVGHSLYPEHQGLHRREACHYMKAVQADLRGQKSLCYAPLDQVRTTTVSCLAEILVFVPRMTSIDECAGPEHHKYHDTRKVRRRCGTFGWSRASFHHTF